MEKAIPYRGDAPYIFISYAHKDVQSVLPIIGTMQASGFRIWFDEGIDPGTEWDNVIAEQIEKSSYFLAFVSENYLASENCKDELNFARDLGKHRLLVYLENVTLPAGMAMRMNRIQSVFKYKYLDESAFYKVLYSADGIYAMCDGAPKEEPPPTDNTEQTAKIPRATVPPTYTPKIKGEIAISAVLKSFFSHIGHIFQKPTPGQVFTRLFVLCIFVSLFLTALGLPLAGHSFLTAIPVLGLLALIITQKEKKSNPSLHVQRAAKKANRSKGFLVATCIFILLSFLISMSSPEATPFFLFWTCYCYFASFIPRDYAKICIGPLKLPRILIRVLTIVFSFLVIGMTT